MQKASDVIDEGEFRELCASLQCVSDALELREAALRSSVGRLERLHKQVEMHEKLQQKLAEQSNSLLVEQHQALTSQLDDILAQARQMRNTQPESKQEQTPRVAAAAKAAEAKQRPAKAAAQPAVRKATTRTQPPAKQYARQTQRKEAGSKRTIESTTKHQAKQQPKQVAATSRLTVSGDESASQSPQLAPHPLQDILQQASVLTQDARWRLKHYPDQVFGRELGPAIGVDSSFALLQKQASLTRSNDALEAEEVQNEDLLEQEQALLESCMEDFQMLLDEVRGLDNPPSCGFTRSLPPAVQLHILQLWYHVNRSLQALSTPATNRRPKQASNNSSKLEAALVLPFPWASELDVHALLALDDRQLLNEVDAFHEPFGAWTQSHTSELVGKSLMRHVVRSLRSCAEGHAKGMAGGAEYSWKVPLSWYRALCECLEARHMPISFTPRQLPR